jgi:hypothetical protein
VHLLAAIPLDSPRLLLGLDLVPSEPAATTERHGGNPATELALSLAVRVGKLNLATRNPGSQRPVNFRRDDFHPPSDGYRPYARTCALDLLVADARSIAAASDVGKTAQQPAKDCHKLAQKPSAVPTGATQINFRRGRGVICGGADASIGPMDALSQTSQTLSRWTGEERTGQIGCE